MLLAAFQFYLSSISRIAQRKIKFPLGAQIIIDNSSFSLFPFFTCFLYRGRFTPADGNKKGTEKAPAKTGALLQMVRNLCYLSNCLSTSSKKIPSRIEIISSKNACSFCSLIKGMFTNLLIRVASSFMRILSPFIIYLLYILAVSLSAPGTLSIYPFSTAEEIERISSPTVCRSE